MRGEVSRMTLLIARTLEPLGILYAVLGWLARSLYGVVRSRLDLDIGAEMDDA